MHAVISEIITETPDVCSFRLKPEQRLPYTAGQWMYVRLPSNEKHDFSISSSPAEDFIQFTTHNTGSDYKRLLWEQKVGDTLEIQGGFGSFVLDENATTPQIFIAGGIGITPFRSMITHILEKKLKITYQLLYSVKTDNDIIFRDILMNNPYTTIINSTAEGRINAAKIKKYCPDWQNSTLWLCGSPAMVEALVDQGQKLGLAPQQIKSEEFSGY